MCLYKMRTALGAIVLLQQLSNNKPLINHNEVCFLKVFNINDINEATKLKELQTNLNNFATALKLLFNACTQV